jgi:hypothetical protein
METLKPEVSFFIRASGNKIDIYSLLSDVKLLDQRKEVWREGDPINDKKNYTNSGVILKIFEGKLDDIRESVLHRVIPYLEQNQSALKLLKSKMSVMIFEIEFNLKKADLFMLGFNLPDSLMSPLRNLGLEVDVTQYFFD